MRGKSTMDNFIKQQLNSIEQGARQIVSSIQMIFGYCDGQETVAETLFPTKQLNHESNEFQKVVSAKTIEEIIK